MGSTTVLLLWPLLLSVVWSQSVITDAGPNEFPYVVKINLKGMGFPKTEAAVVVSKRYILASGNTKTLELSNLDVTDQSGKVRPIARAEAFLSYKFAYLKVCEKFEGATMPMTASSFNDLSADVNSTGFLLFFNASSHVLRKLPASAMSTANCAKADGGNYLCTYQDSTPGYCSFYTDDTPSYTNTPLIAFGNQVQGRMYGPACDSKTGDMSGSWTFHNYAHHSQSIISNVPEVDIK
ncbi:uncharacterized protein LOC135941756 [Cloeon dipterum]|uniref:uncharacterized protein LOC135941756 n=1 Tax=Cloeon dipterum TaxID=197152 RepID=UPI00321FE7DA